jgi:adenosylhomocysteine nucleosidase
MSMLAIIGALDEEVSGLRREMTLTETSARPAIFVGQCRSRDVVLARSGVGRERAERATRAVLERYPVTGIVSLGFGGALTPDLQAGELIVSTLVKCPDTAESHNSDPKLVGLAGGRCGTGVTVADLAPDSAAKRRLGVTYAADVVDMECYWVARLAAEKGVPFLSVRAISDAVDEVVPNLFPDGTRLGLMLAVARHPLRVFGHPLALLRLYRNVRRAKANLTQFAIRLIEAAG